MGIPGAFIVWYGRIYNAASYDRAVTFMCYFFGSGAHIGFCLWASIRTIFNSCVFVQLYSVAIPAIGIGSSDDSSFTGLIEVFDKFDKALWLGVFYLIGFIMWAGNVVLSIYVWQQAMRDFRGRGGPQQVQSQAQAAAGRAVLASATGGRV